MHKTTSHKAIHALLNVLFLTVCYVYNPINVHLVAVRLFYSTTLVFIDAILIIVSDVILPLLAISVLLTIDYRLDLHSVRLIASCLSARHAQQILHVSSACLTLIWQMDDARLLYVRYSTARHVVVLLSVVNAIQDTC